MQYRWKKTSTQSELKFELRGPIAGKGWRSMVCLLFFSDPSSLSLASSSRLWAGEKRQKNKRSESFNHIRKPVFLHQPCLPGAASRCWLSCEAFLWAPQRDLHSVHFSQWVKHSLGNLFWTLPCPSPTCLTALAQQLNTRCLIPEASSPFLGWTSVRHIWPPWSWVRNQPSCSPCSRPCCLNVERCPSSHLQGSLVRKYQYMQPVGLCMFPKNSFPSAGKSLGVSVVEQASA